MERTFKVGPRIFPLWLLFLSVGCGAPYEIGQVSGTLKIKGKPGHKIRIEFIPDVGVEGPPSFAETDSQGNFVLRLMDSKNGSPEGAIVGTHRVTLSDLQLAESETGRGVPIRLNPNYSLPGSTPLKQDVKSGDQTISLEIP